MSSLPIRWERDLEPVGPADRPKGHLLGTLLIGGIPHHAEAFEVEDRDDLRRSRETPGVCSSEVTHRR
jgi:hypothetical protein